MTDFSPAYLQLMQNGELQERAEQARRALENCHLCPRACGTDRRTSTGICRTGVEAIVASYGPHHGEESPLVGRHGSGTIFFGHCNLTCRFCQNWEISQRGEGRTTSAAELARVMLGLQQLGCHNINLVTPSHVVAQTLEALVIAADEGLRLPLVYNTGGYDSLATLRMLDGVVDIYMPDMKFADSRIAEPLLGVADYAEINRSAVREMHRQVGDLQTSPAGVARRGLLVRLLVMPENLAGVDRTLKFIAEDLSRETYLNLMDQYRPCHRAHERPPLDRRIRRSEMHQAREWARESGLTRLDRP